jgi:hypothetical protein
MKIKFLYANINNHNSFGDYQKILKSYPELVISDLLCTLENGIIASFGSHPYGLISSCYLHCECDLTPASN